jgi:hypothetical protein
VAISLGNLAGLLQSTNRLAEAEPSMRRALAIFEESLGAEHPSTETVRGNLEALLAALAREGRGSDGGTGGQDGGAAGRGAQRAPPRAWFARLFGRG